MNQMSTVVNRLEAKMEGRLPLRLKVNLKNVSAMTLEVARSERTHSGDFEGLE